MDHVVDVESEQGAIYTALTFDFAVGNSFYKIAVKETPDEIHVNAVSNFPRSAEVKFPSWAGFR